MSQPPEEVPPEPEAAPTAEPAASEERGPAQEPDGEPWSSPAAERFTDADLEPAAELRAAGRRLIAELGATAAAVLIAGLWLGVVLTARHLATRVLGALLPEALASRLGEAMAQRADRWGLGLAAGLLATEIVRTVVARGRGRLLAARLRRMVVLVLGGCAVLLAVVLGAPDAGPAAASSPGAAAPALGGLGVQGGALRSFELVLLVLLVLLEVATLPRLTAEPEEGWASPKPPGPPDDEQRRAA